MKKCIVVVLALALVAGLGQAGSAAEPGRQLSKGALANLGLGGARPMTDAEGLEVRGMSIAIVMGVGAASVIFTDADPSVVSVVQMDAYGAVDTGNGGQTSRHSFGGNRLRAYGTNEGAAEVANSGGLIVGGYFGGSSLAKVGVRRSYIPSH